MFHAPAPSPVTAGPDQVLSRLAAELGVRQLDRLKHRLLDVMASGVVVQDPAGRMVWCNEAAEAALGITVDELVDRTNDDPAWRAVRPDLTDLAADEFPSVTSRRTGRAQRDVILGIYRPDGGLSWLNVDTFPLHDDSGALLAVASVFDEITPQLETSRDLARSQEQVRDLLDCMTDAYFTLDEHWTFVFVNRQAEAVLGRARHDLIGASLWSRFPDAGGHFEHQLDRAMTGHAVEFESNHTTLGAWFEVRAHPIPDGIAVYVRDVSERHRAAEERDQLLVAAEAAKTELARAAASDSLTRLANRTSLMAWLDDGLDRCAPGAELALLFLDLDRFKLVNDTHGHAEGDALLVEAARRLVGLVAPSDLVARLGGDEFVVGLSDRSPDAISALARRLLLAFRAPFDVGRRRFVVTASIGIALAGPGATPDTLLRDADAALYQAKDAGRNRVRLFDDEIRQAVVARLTTEADLREALERRSLTVHYQPIYDAASGRPVAVEALSRWHHPDRGMISPTDFVPVAEESGLIVPLGQLVFDLVSSDVAELDRALGLDRATVWVNVSARQLEALAFAGELVTRCEEAHLVGRIGLEVTETALSHDAAATEATLHRLAEAGLQVAIDDFGTGYSSLARLVDYPVDMIKIDRSFVHGLATGGTVAIVAAIIELAHALGARACAEGVETAAQLDQLRSLGVDLVSGHHLCRPAAVADLAGAIAAGRAASHRAGRAGRDAASP